MDRYDRQRRLWSGSGQRRLHSSRVQILGASTAATEVAKSLVLAGVGLISWKAPLPVSDDLVATNFFLTDVDVSKPFDLAITESLNALNPDVTLEVGQISNPDLIIATSYPTSSIVDMLHQSHSPMLQIDAVGFYARVHLWLRKPLAIVETHSSKQWDIRFQNLWTEYAEYVSKCPIDADTPWCVILAKCRSAYQGDLTRSEFGKYVRNHALNGSQENIEEAAASAWRALKDDNIPKSLIKLMEWASKCDEQDSDFTRGIKAIARFYELHGTLPLNGDLPDMRASTQRYLEVLEIFRSKALKDAEEVAQLGNIELNLARKFCQNVRTLRLVLPDKNLQDQIPNKGLSKMLDDTFINSKYESDSSSSLHKMPFLGPGGEIYSVASLIGGIGSQECTKVLMAQYTPICGEILYDGLEQRTYISRSGMVIN